MLDYRGGMSTRAGTRYVATCGQDPTVGPPVLIPFTVSTIATYMLEFGNEYINVYSNGAFVVQVASPYLQADLPLLRNTLSLPASSPSPTSPTSR